MSEFTLQQYTNDEVNRIMLINKFTPGPWWFQWSVLGWGIGLAFHFKAIFFPHGKKYDNRVFNKPFMAKP